MSTAAKERPIGWIDFTKRCRARSVTCERVNADCWRIHGRIVVEWYPHSERRTAILPKERLTIHACSADRAIQLALEPPSDTLTHGELRARNYLRKVRTRRIRARGRCVHCCCRLIEPSVVRLECLIPLEDGGTAAFSNLDIACQRCSSTNQRELIRSAGRWFDERQAFMRAEFLAWEERSARRTAVACRRRAGGFNEPDI